MISEADFFFILSPIFAIYSAFVESVKINKCHSLIFSLLLNSNMEGYLYPRLPCVKNRIIKVNNPNPIQTDKLEFSKDGFTGYM